MAAGDNMADGEGSEKPPRVKYYDQTEINNWQRRIFGLEDKDALAIFDKLLGEVSELYTATRKYDGIHATEVTDELRSKFARECADVYVVLCQLAGRFGVRLHEEVNAKMYVNEFEREWNVTADGIGQHVAK